MRKINVSYLMSYDYGYLFTSLECIYEYVDQIIISVDKKRKTWSGNDFIIESDFFDKIKQIDSRNIIEIYEDDFYIKDLTPMECETRQRNLTLKKLNKGWKIQLDVDEYIYDFKEVKKILLKYWYLTLFPNITPIGFIGRLVTLFKINKEEFYYIDNQEYFPFITNQNFNTKARNNFKIFNYILGVNVIHQSWARKEEEIYAKIKNWGHRDDFDTMRYFNYWKNLNSDNYLDYKNFHPIVPEVWDELQLIKAKDIDDFIKKYSTLKSQNLIKFDLINYLKSILYKKIKIS